MAFARVAMLVPLLTAGSFAGDSGEWPRFRGENGAGVSEATGLPVEFGPGKNEIWKTAVPFSRSSPVVAGGRVFLTAFEHGKLITISLDAATGRVVWRKEIDRPARKEIYKANDPASPTPATDGQNVYAFFPDFGIVSYDARGGERWRLPLEPFDSYFGLASSPILSGDLLLLNCDARSKAFLIAVDTGTGRERWRADRKEIHFEGYTTPVLYQPASGPEQVIVLGAQRVDAYQVSTGERLWWFTGLASCPVASPVISGGMVVGSTWGSDAALPAFDSHLKKLDKDKDGRLTKEEVKGTEFYDDFGALDANGDGWIDRAEYDGMRNLASANYGLVALKPGGRGDLTSSGMVWREKKTWPSLASPVLYNGILYFTKGGGILVSMDPATGKTYKVARAKDALEEHWASPVAADGKVMFISESGKVNVLRAGEQWDILAVNQIGEDVFATPAIAGGRIYLRGRSSLYCFGK